MAGYCSNLPASFRLGYASKKAQWQVWQVFSKLSHRKVEREDKGRKGERIGITMGISCHTCHAFSVFGLGKRFRAIATCHRTCHELAASEGSGKPSLFLPSASNKRSPTSEGGKPST
jgi:hypothetical protein